MTIISGWDTCVPTPKIAKFQFFESLFILKYLKTFLELIFTSFNPLEVGHQGVGTQADDDAYNVHHQRVGYMCPNPQGK